MLGSVELKSDDQIRTMRRAGLITRAALEAARAACVPGATTADVDAAGARVIVIENTDDTVAAARERIYASTSKS